MLASEHLAVCSLGRLRQAGILQRAARVTALLARAYRAVHDRLEASAVMNRTALDERDRDRAGGHPIAVDPKDHLLAAIDWLVRAHEASSDGGVSRGYAVAWHPYFRSRGWQPSYPETTGYLIPTMFNLASRWNRADLRQRAIRMADWELEVQLPSGAVQSGVIGEQATPTPAVFNTGQALFGLVRAHQETGRDEYLTGAQRAAEYMLGALGPDGGFVKGRSAMAREDCTTYYTRAAWGLCVLGVHVHEARYVAAAERNIRYGISRQLENGWFQANCLTEPERPLLHTIAYAVEGILGVGLLLGREEYVQAARRSARALAARQRPDGGLAGRFASDWSPQTPWDCLTGDAQIATVWWTLGESTADAELRDRARRLCGFVMRAQNRTAPDAGLRGGVKGSFPIDGDYGRYEVLSWSTKFFVDALLLTLPAQQAAATESREAQP